MSEQEGLGSVLSRMCRGVASLIITGSFKLEEAADGARDAGTILDQVEEAVEQDAQRMLDSIDDVLTSWNTLNCRAVRYQSQVNNWREQARAAAQKAVEAPVGSAEKAKLENLVRSAIEEAQRVEAQLTPLLSAIAEARPDAEHALEMLEQVGLRREQALSERDRLDIANATSEARRNLALASQNGGVGQATALLNEASQKVDLIRAQAETEEIVGEVFSQSSENVSAQIGQLGRKSSVESEFSTLMNEVSANTPVRIGAE